jgi:hypothetical protein
MTGTESRKQTNQTAVDRSELGIAQAVFTHRSSRLTRRGALLSVCFAALALASAARAQVILVDDFESYADSTALRMAWVAQAPLLSTSVTLDTSGITGQSMSIAYDVSTGTNAVEFTFGADQDYSLRTTFRIIYEASGSTDEDLVFELRDSMDNVLVSGVAPDGTSVASAAWEVNLVPFVQNLAHVRKIRLAIRDGGDMTGTGTVLFDDLSTSSGTYSTCRSCHGEFVGKPYVAFTDGQTWTPDLHDVHRNIMLNFDCNTCHKGNTFFPVFIGSSNGGTGLPGVGCLGCHGREEDKGHDTISSGRAAGLNQHHHRSGVTECAKCHSDADPANYKPVGENVHPAYFFTPDAAHPAKPTDPCTSSELFVSLVQGLDNDGDLNYELNDSDCQRAAPAPALSTIGLVVSLGLLLGLGIWRLRPRKRTQE